MKSLANWRHSILLDLPEWTFSKLPLISPLLLSQNETGAWRTHLCILSFVDEKYYLDLDLLTGYPIWKWWISWYVVNNNSLKFTTSILNTLYTYLNKVGGSLYVIEIKWSFSRNWTIKPGLQKSCPFGSEFVGSPLIRLANSCNARKDSLKKKIVFRKYFGGFHFGRKKFFHTFPQLMCSTAASRKKK